MSARDEIIRLARDEVRNKLFAYSQQLLAVHEIAMDEAGDPQIAYIDEDELDSMFGDG